MLSIVVPTLNAAATLAQTLASVAGDGLPAREVIVVDGGSVDETRAIATAGGAIVIDAPRGRGTQLRAGVDAASGDWLMVLHADTVLGPGWAADVQAFTAEARHRDRAGYFRFALDDPARAARRVEWAVAWRCRLLGLPYGDQGLVISRSFYDTIGGYRRIPLMEDVDIVKRIGRGRLVALKTKAITSAVRYRQDGYVARPLRNFLCLGLYSLGVPSRYIVPLYR